MRLSALRHCFALVYLMLMTKMNAANAKMNETDAIASYIRSIQNANSSLLVLGNNSISRMSEFVLLSEVDQGTYLSTEALSRNRSVNP